MDGTAGPRGEDETLREGNARHIGLVISRLSCLPSFLQECHGFTLFFQARRLDIVKCSYTKATTQACAEQAGLDGRDDASSAYTDTASNDVYGFGHNDSLCSSLPPALLATHQPSLADTATTVCRTRIHGLEHTEARTAHSCNDGRRQ